MSPRRAIQPFTIDPSMRANVENGRIAVISIDKTKPAVQIESIANGSIVESEDLTVR
ncbi:MAG: hypothetical protein ABSB83_06230 [Methanomassiliicoccales archaeon]